MYTRILDNSGNPFALTDYYPVASGDLRGDRSALEKLWEAESVPRSTIQYLRFLAYGKLLPNQTRKDETAAAANERRHFAPRLFGMAVEKFSYLYSTPPHRKNLGEVWEHMFEFFDLFMREVDMEARLSGSALILALPAAEDDAHKVDLFCVPRDQFVALPSLLDPRKIAAVKIQWTPNIWREIHRTGDGAIEFVQILNARGKVEREIKNIYDHFPICVAPNTKQSKTWEGRSPFGEADVQNILTINYLWDVLAECAELQRGQPVQVGGEEPKNAVLSPRVIHWVDSQVGTAKFEIVRPGSDISGIIDTIQTKLDALSASWGMPKGTMQIRTVQAPHSAAVVVAMQNELRQDRELRKELAFMWEHRIHELAAKMYDDGVSRPRYSSLALDFPPPQFALTINELINVLRFCSDAGIMDPRYTLRQLFPGLSEDELDGMIDMGRKYQQEITDRISQRAGHLRPTGPDGDKGGRPTENQDKPENENGETEND